MEKLKGTYNVLITPFDANDRLDEEGLQQLIEIQLENQIDGLVCLGTTGEAPTLSEEEKTRVIAISRKHTPKHTPLVVGTGSYSTSDTIKHTLQAQQMGADMALIVSPYYNRPTQEGLYQHFKAIAQATTIPIILYNVPIRTGHHLHIDTFKKLMDIPNIVGIKEASGNITQITDTIEAVNHVRPDFKVMSGDDGLTFPLMALGGHGVLSVVSNLIPQGVKSLTDAMLAGDLNLARELHFRLLPLFKAAFVEPNPTPIKALMNIAGFPAGHCRLPLSPLTQENLSYLKCIVKDYLPSPQPALR